MRGIEIRLTFYRLEWDAKYTNLQASTTIAYTFIQIAEWSRYKLQIIQTRKKKFFFCRRGVGSFLYGIYWTKCLIFNGFCVWLNVKIFWFYNQMKRAIAFY